MELIALVIITLGVAMFAWSLLRFARLVWVAVNGTGGSTHETRVNPQTTTLRRIERRMATIDRDVNRLAENIETYTKRMVTAKQDHPQLLNIASRLDRALSRYSDKLEGLNPELEREHKALRSDTLGIVRSLNEYWPGWQDGVDSFGPKVDALMVGVEATISRVAFLQKRVDMTLELNLSRDLEVPCKRINADAEKSIRILGNIRSVASETLIQLNGGPL